MPDTLLMSLFKNNKILLLHWTHKGISWVKVVDLIQNCGLRTLHVDIRWVYV